MSRFPLLTETFILREMLELERVGVPLAIFPLLRAEGSVRHAEVDGLRAEVDYTPFLSRRILAANWRMLCRSPGRYVRLLASALWYNLGDRNLLSGAIGIFPKSVYFAEQVERLGIKHVHAHFATHPALAALIVSELAGLSFSFTAHAHDIFVHKAMLAQKVRKASFVAAISEYNRRLLLELARDVSPDRVSIVRCGIQVEQYAERESERTSGPPVALCVASLQPYKGLRHLIRASALVASQVPGFRCRIIGEGSQRHELQALIVELGVAETVELMGGRPQHEVIQLLKGADLFVLPSVVAPSGQMEGIPVALMEAMASELPVIATAISGIPELVQDQHSGMLVEPEDDEALAQAIVRLCKDPALRRRFGHAGRGKVASDYQLEPNVALLRECFAKAAAGKDEGPPSALIKRVATHLGAPSAEGLSITRIRSGANSRVFVLARPEGGERQELILKIHQPASTDPFDPARDGAPYAASEYAALTEVSLALAKRQALPTIPQPIDFIPEEAALVMTRIPGQSLASILRLWRFRPGGGLELRVLFEKAGRWLAQFQAVTRKTEDSAAQIIRLRREFERDIETCGGRGLSLDLVAKAKRYFDQNIDDLDPLTLRVVGRHCDFAPYNVLVARERIAVIDFEGLQPGLVTDDLCWFLAMVDEMPSYHLSTRSKAALRAAFLQGFEQEGGSLPRELGAFLMASMAKVMASTPLLRREGPGLDQLKRHQRLTFYKRWFKERLT
jgi:glycosyltransferase involved in cell wall biosynthesis/aminoglycoside phosphotransferase (APT) family kinase protein